MSEVARNARQVSRSLDALIAACRNPIEDGIPLSGLGNADATGRLFFQTRRSAGRCRRRCPPARRQPDPRRGAGAAGHASRARRRAGVEGHQHARSRRARSGCRRGLLQRQGARGHRLLYTGIMQLPASFWDRHGKDMESWQHGGFTSTGDRAAGRRSMLVNQFVYLEGDAPFLARSRNCAARPRCCRCCATTSTPRTRLGNHGAQPRAELRAEPADGSGVDFVTLLGQAGTGKTLLALAAGLMQTLETKRYSEIIVTRATVPVGEDIGFLPGTEEEKMRRGWARSRTTSKC
jgi:PhoH-like ATPase